MANLLGLRVRTRDVPHGEDHLDARVGAGVLLATQGRAVPKLTAFARSTPTT